MGKLLQFIKRRGILAAMLIGGLYCTGLALWNLGCTALYHHKAVILPATVCDVRQRPFESWSEALRYGNLPWDGDIAYKPILAVTMPNGIRIRALTLPDLDNQDYRMGEQVELITHPYDPNQAHVHKWKFLWGADTMLLGLGALLAVPSWFILFPRRKRKGAPAPKRAPREQQRPARQQQRRPQPAQHEEPFTLANDTPEPRKPRAPRQKKAAYSDAPAKPRAPRKKKETDPNAPVKPRKPRKKNSDAN